MTVDWMQNVLVILVLKYIQNNWQLCTINSERNMYNIYKYISPPCFNVIKLSLHGLNWARPVFYKEKESVIYWMGASWCSRLAMNNNERKLYKYRSLQSEMNIKGCGAW